MHIQVWIGAILAAKLFLAVASEWVQLSMVEPGGKIKFKPRPHDIQDLQIQTPEAHSRTDGTQMKVETMNLINKFPPKGIPDIPTNQFSVERITKHNTDTDQSGTQIHNSESNLKENDPVITSSAANNYGSQMPEETVTFIQPTYQWPFEPLLETEPSDIKIPQFKVHSNTKPPKFSSKLDPEITTIKADAEFPNPVAINHNSELEDSAYKTSNTLHETNSTPNPEVMRTGFGPNESEASWKSRKDTNSSSTRENIVQDSSSPLDMLRVVHNTLIQETPHTVRGKMHFLQKLKNRMLHYMEGHIKNLWTDDHERQARTEKGMGFPSMEGALMSISFLIFAVFLIKLVQQLIQSLQGHNTMAMMTGRHTRSLPDLLTTARVLQLIDEFPLQYEDNSWT